MASNNRKPQQRWSRDGNDRERFPSLGQRAQQRPGGAFKAKRGMDVRKVEEALDDMFLNVFDAEIIRAVAQACDWKLDSAVEKLLTLSIGHDSEDTRKKSTIPGSCMLQPERTQKHKISKIPSGSLQQPMEDTAHKPVPSAPEMSLWPGETSFSKPKSVLMNAGHGTIKVTYRGQADADASDDDADVVIEEEKEFEVYGFDTPLGIPSSQPMCQFLTPLVTAEQQTFSGMLPPGGLIASKPSGWKDTLEGAIPRSNSDASMTGTKKNKHWPKLEKIKKWICEGIKVMVLMRGCPGSGKTSLARHIIKLTYGENHQNYVFSADQFFSLSGKYVFNPKQLPEAHDWNRRRVVIEARRGTTPIIIDNTNIEAWEMKPYAQIAVEYGYIVELLEPRTSWKNNAAECERKNIHGVSRRKIEDMLNRFDQKLTTKSLLAMYSLNYSSNNKPPQLTKLTHLRQDASQLNSTKKKSKKKTDNNKAKKKDTKNSSEPEKKQEIQSNNVLRDLVNIAWQQLPINSFLPEISDIRGGITDSNASASPSVTELMNWLQDHDQESRYLTDTQIPEPKPVQEGDIRVVRGNDKANEMESSEDEAEAVCAAGMLDDESIDDDDDDGDDDLNFDGFEESDSGNEIVTLEKKVETENVNTCMEYVLLCSDGSAVPQFDHTEEELTLQDVAHIPKRTWEYLVSQEELDELINPRSCEANSNSSSPCSEKVNISKMEERELTASTIHVDHNLQITLREGGSLMTGIEDKTIEEVVEEFASVNKEIFENDKLDAVNKDIPEKENLVGKTSEKSSINHKTVEEVAKESSSVTKEIPENDKLDAVKEKESENHAGKTSEESGNEDKTIEEVANESASVNKEISENDKLDAVKKDIPVKENLAGKTSEKSGIEHKTIEEEAASVIKEIPENDELNAVNKDILEQENLAGKTSEESGIKDKTIEEVAKESASVTKEIPENDKLYAVKKDIPEKENLAGKTSEKSGIEHKTIGEEAKESASVTKEISENDKLGVVNNDITEKENLVGKTSGESGIVQAENFSNQGVENISRADVCNEERSSVFLDYVKTTEELVAENIDVKLVSRVESVCAPENCLTENQKENLTDKASDNSCVYPEASNIYDKDLKESSESLEIRNDSDDPEKFVLISCKLEESADVLCMEGDHVSTVEVDTSGNEGKIKPNTVTEFENVCESVCSDVSKQSEIIISVESAFESLSRVIAEEVGKGQEKNRSAADTEGANNILRQELALANKCVSEPGIDIGSPSKINNEEVKEYEKEISVVSTDIKSKESLKELIGKDERSVNNTDDPGVSEVELLENEKDSVSSKIITEPCVVQAKSEALDCISFLEVDSSMSVENKDNNNKENCETQIESAIEQIVGNEKENLKVNLENAGKTLHDEHVGNLVIQREMEIGPGEESEQLVVSLTGDNTCAILNQESGVMKSSENNILNNSGCAEEDSEPGENVLEIWESGGRWDENGKEESLKEGSRSGESSPKPARQNRRQGSTRARVARSLSPIRTEKEKKGAVDEDVWVSAVEDPLKSWEKSSDGTNLITLQPVIVKEPQPQRNVFAMQKLDDKIMWPGDEDKAAEIASQDFENFLSTPDITGTGRDTGPEVLLSGTSDFQEQITVEYQKAPTEEGAWGGTCTSAIETNTHHSDFILLSNINIGSEVTVHGVKVMPAFCRDISNEEVAISDTPEPRKLGVHTLDKSSMTVDTTGVSVESGNIEEHVQELHRMFPSFPFDALRELFEKCNKDINWTVDLLLESVNQGIDICTGLNVSNLQGDLSVAEGEGNETIVIADCSNSFSNDNSQFTADGRSKSAPSARRSSKKDRNAPLSEKSFLLKKQLEENIVINDEHYSEHVSRIRKIRHGELTDVPESEVGNTQSSIDFSSSPSDISIWQAPEPSSSSHSLRPEAPEWEIKELSPVDVSFEEEEEENVQLKLDNTFAEQLHKLFGTASLPFKQDSLPTLNVPMTLARQLHYYLMEAEQTTYDAMMQEDEELARQLQQQEDARDSDIESKPADLREIMEMEMALAMYKADQKQFRDESKDDMATRLKKNLLCEWFPSLPRDILVNVFEAHDHSFDQTIEVLFASTEEDNTVRTVMSPEARAAYEKALIERARQESVKTAEPSEPPHSTEDHSEVTQERAFQDADFYRAEATRFYSLRNECQTKAQRAYQRGHPSVAAYYSQMAALHKLKIEENNARAASSLLLAHSLGNLTTTLDLHFLYVVEAIQVLDMFLDHHVHKLSGSPHRSKQVFVITGRGARSTGGRSRIKPAVVQRLEQRGLRHTEVNPGLLGITITRNSALSTSVDS